MDRSTLFDADAYFRSGRMPWSFLAWPSEIDDSDGLPKDEETLRFLDLLQQSGVPLSTWRLPDEVGVPHTWAVVRSEDSKLIVDALAALEESGAIPADYLNALTNRLMEKRT
ncbi:MAG: hypothetical protein ACF8NJ_06855 [Phycisphaerales bacterium JB038]